MRSSQLSWPSDGNGKHVSEVRCICFTCELDRLTDRITAYRFVRLVDKGELTLPDPKKPRNLLRLAGVINAANAESDNEAGELIDRVRLNQSRALSLIAKAHQSETLREQALSEAEKEQALADLAEAIGDNGGPLLDTEDDAAADKIRAELAAAKRSKHTSQSSSGNGEEKPQNTEQTQVIATPEVGQPPFQS